MSEFGTTLLMAVGLVFVIEGLLYALAPGMMRRMMQTALDLPQASLQKGGIFAIAFGVAIVWLMKS